MNFPLRIIAFLLFLPCGVGCAMFGNHESIVEDIRPQVEASQQAAIERFEQKRNAAELSAARRLLEQGDLPGGLSALEAILQRTPTHREARLLMAETQLVLGDMTAADSTLAVLLQYDETDAQAHYQLAMLAESKEQPARALRHAKRAHEIEPASALYLLLLDELEDDNALAAMPAGKIAPDN